MKNRFVIAVIVALTSFHATAALASNCEKVYKVAGSNEWTNEDIGVTLVSFKNGKIISFMMNGHGSNLPTFDLAQVEKNDNGTFNLFYEGRSTGEERRRAEGMTAVMRGYKYSSKEGRISINSFRVEEKTHQRVYCYGGPE